MHRYLLVAIAFLIFACQDESGGVTTDSGLYYEILTEGTGVEAAIGDTITIHEKLSYRNGEVIYDTKRMEVSIPVVIGVGQVIEGVDEGLRGMKTGEIRKLIVPTHLSQRERYPDFLSKDSILVYEIEVVDIKKE